MRHPDKFIELIDECISSHMEHKRLSVQELANHCGYSRMSLYRNIKKATGLTPSQYLTEKKLHTAVKLLVNTNEPIKVISKRAGFSDNSYFSKKFKETFGCTPSSYCDQLK